MNLITKETKMTRRILIGITAMALLGLAVLAIADSKMSGDMTLTASVGKAAPNFTLTDANGETHSLSDFKGKYVVLEWTNFGCPFVVAHYNSGNMPQLQADMSKKDVVWLSICSSAPGKQGYYEGKELKAAIEKNGLKSSAYLIDADGTVGRMYNAKTTPNMYVVDPNGTLIYAGAIDDHPTVKQDEVKGSTNYVKAALMQAMAGEKIAVSNTQPYGCGVKYADR